MKHRYPPRYRQHTKTQSNSQNHTRVQANNTTQATDSTVGLSTTTFGFTREELQSLRALLQQSQLATIANAITTSPSASNSHSLHYPSKNPKLWVFDTRATNHIAFH